MENLNINITEKHYYDAERACRKAYEKHFNIKLGNTPKKITTKDGLIEIHREIIKLFLDLKPRNPKTSYDFALYALCSAKIKETVEKLKLIN